MNTMLRRLGLCFGALLAAGVGAAPAAAQEDHPHGHRGAVFTMSNAAEGNELLVLARRPNGTLEPAGSLPTGGDGTGGGLGNQGGLILAFGGHVLYAVNAGSGEISVFVVTHHGPALIQVVDAGGERPISLTQHGRRLYVLNADGGASGADHINGFVIGPWGTLSPLANSMRALSAGSTGPAQVGFSPNGRALVVTEKATNTITVYRMGAGGLPGAPMPQASEGETPFGFDFGRGGALIVSEAFGGAPNASAVSSYTLSNSGMLTTVSASVPTGQTAACWIAPTANGRFAYTTNTGSHSVSGYRVGSGGVLTPLTPGAPTAATGMGPIDASVVGNRYLYILAQGSGEINAYRIAHDGSLTAIDTDGGLPPAANGLAAR